MDPSAVDLPKGFALEDDTSKSADLPEGFQVEAPTETFSENQDALDKANEVLARAEEFANTKIEHIRAPSLEQIPQYAAKPSLLLSQVLSQGMNHALKTIYDFAHGATSAQSPVIGKDGQLDIPRTIIASGLQGVKKPETTPLPGAQFQKAYPNLHWLITGSMGTALDFLPMLLGGEKATKEIRLNEKISSTGASEAVGNELRDLAKNDPEKFKQRFQEELQKRMTPEGMAHAEKTAADIVSHPDVQEIFNKIPEVQPEDLPKGFEMEKTVEPPPPGPEKAPEIAQIQPPVAEPPPMVAQGEPKAPAPQEPQIPTFKSTNEAVAHGKAVNGDKTEIEKLEKGLEALQPGIEKAMKEGDFQGGMDLATKKQFLNEALKHAKKTPEIIDAEKAGKVVGIDAETQLPIIDRSQPATSSEIAPKKTEPVEIKASDKQINQNQPMSLLYAGKKYPVASVSEAQDKWDAIRNEGMKQGLGPDDVSGPSTGPMIVDAKGKTIGRLSWNASFFKEPDTPKIEASKKTLIKGAGPQVHSIVRELPREKGDLPDEKFYEVQNDTTSKKSVVEAKDLRPISSKEAPAKIESKKPTVKHESIPPPKEELLAKINDAIKNIENLPFPPGDPQDLTIEFYRNFKIPEKIKFKVNGAEFKIWNHPESLQNFKNRIEKGVSLSAYGNNYGGGLGAKPIIKNAPKTKVKLNDELYQEKQANFYSALERTIEEKMPNVTSPEQVRGILNNSGVKKEEMDWLDVESFLANKQFINKQELLEFIRANNVKVEEVVKGRDYREKDNLKRKRESGEMSEEEYVRRRDELRAMETTKFGQYQLPGGENYRELLLTLPVADMTIEEAIKTGKKRHVEESTFKSSHFDEPNILAHVRFNERTDSEGKRVLFIEEVQSDWHQKGRKQGYQTPGVADQEAIDYLRLNEKQDRTDAEDSRLEKLENELMDRYEIEDIEDLTKRMQNEVKISKEGVPDAPFKKTWHELAMKRMLRFASESGSEAWNEATKPQSFRTEYENLFGGKDAPKEILSGVEASVLSVFKHNQVKRAIVKFIPVDVVDTLTKNGLTPDQLISNSAMVFHALPADARSFVATGLRTALRKVGTQLRAALNSSLPTGRDFELLPALKASNLDASEIVGLLAPLRVANTSADSGIFGRTDTTTEGSVSRTPSDKAGVSNEPSSTQLATLLNSHNSIINRNPSKSIKFEPAYEILAWTRGEQQAERYDLSKQVESIEWLRGIEPDTYQLTVTGKNGERILTNDIVQTKNLADTVGKEIAEKIVNSKEREGELSGLDLKVGGEGMKGFYDQIIPSFLNKYTKKWGGKVGKALFDFGKTEGGYDRMYADSPGELSAAHAIELTPSMKESVMGGQPLFQGKSEGTPSTFEAESKKLQAVFGRNGIKTITIKLAKEIRTPSGNEAHGSYSPSDKVVKIISEPLAITGYHEAFHALLRNSGIDLDLVESAFAEVQAAHGVDRSKAEEIMADQFADSANNWDTIGGKMKNLFQKIWDWIKKLIGRLSPKDNLREMFRKMYEGQPAKEDVTPSGDEMFNKQNQIETKAFKDWFGDSKVVDDNGEPLKVYHGTDKQFTTFDTSATKEFGAHFTPNPEMANEFTGADGGNVIPAYLSLKNPYDLVSDLGDWTDIDMWREYLGPANEGGFTKKEINAWQNAEDVKKALIAKGYDGIKYQNSFEGNTDTDMGSEAQDVYIAFHPEQIKSATGNRGKFDPKNPDIRYQEKESTGEEGFIDPAVMNDAAQKAIKDGLDYVHQTRDIVRFTGNLERDFNRVLTNAVADEIRAKKLIKEANISPNDAEAIYHYAENKQEPITPEQKAIYDKYIAPLQDARNKLFTVVVGAGVPLSNEDYTPRFVANRGGIFDRLKNTGKGTGGGFLRQTTESMKSRVMRSATNAEGKRIVVAVKGQDVFWGKQPFGSLEQPKGPKFKEFYDKILMESLNKLAKDLGIKHERAAGGSGLGGNRAGVSFQGGRLVKTRYATPERVLLHEIGHQLDYMYGMQDIFIKNSTPAEKKEIRNLVDLKWQDQVTSDYFKKYVRIGTEKIAALFESYLHVPEQFKTIAPLTYKKFTDFLASKPELKPILELKPSMVLGMTKVAPERLEKDVFLDNEGKKWTLGDATTKEIEAVTDLRYHKNILLNELTTYNKLNKVSRAIDFLNAFKDSPEFEKVGMEIGSANAPTGWKPTQLQQFRGYMFEPHVADALDKFAGDIQSKNAGNVLTAVNQFLRNAIFFNPFMHIPNIGAHWTVNRGMVGSAKTVLPKEFARFMRTSYRAGRAIATQNQDYLDMLESGANLLYSGQTEKLSQMMLKAMGENKTTMQRVGEQFGIANPVNWLKTVYNVSGKATWFTNDLAIMQTVYDHIENGMDMEHAIEETVKHIPDYRVPSRIFNSAFISKVMRDPNLTMFGAYHYGMLKSYGEMAKTIASDAPPKEKAEVLDKLLMLGVMMIFIYPFLDKLIQKLKHDPNAHVRRAGATTFVDQLQKLSTGEKSGSDVAQSIVTPAVGTKTLAEVFLNRDFRTGKKVYNPGNEVEDLKNKAIQSISPTKSAQDVISGRKSFSDFAWSLAGVSSHEEKTPAKIKATQLMADNLPQGSKTEEEQADALERSKIGADYRKTRDIQVLKGAVDAGQLTHTQANFIYKHADDTFLERVTRSVSWRDIPKIMEKANPDEMVELTKIFNRKVSNAMKKTKYKEEKDRIAEEADALFGNVTKR